MRFEEIIELEESSKQESSGHRLGAVFCVDD